MVTSRHERRWSKALQQWLSLPLENSCLVNDIRTYIGDRMFSDEGFVKRWNGSPGLLFQLSSELALKAGHMFHLAARQIDVMAACKSTEDLSTARCELPDDINEIYDRILDSAPVSDQERIELLLQMIMHSPEPVTLNTYNEALAIDIRRGIIDIRKQLVNVEDILDWCPGFFFFQVSSDLPTGAATVRFAHESVHIYLLSGKMKSEFKPDMSLVAIHEKLWEICRIQLSSSPKAIGTGNEDHTSLSRFAAQHWSGFAYALEQHRQTDTQKVLDLYLSGRFSLHSFQESLEHTGLYADSNGVVRSSARRAALIHACEHGLVRSAARLYDFIRVPHADFRDLACECLGTAVYNAHVDVVGMLLAKGADMNVSGPQYGSALHAAVRNPQSNTRVLHVLLSEANRLAEVGLLSTATFRQALFLSRRFDNEKASALWARYRNGLSRSVSGTVPYPLRSRISQ
ncbi:Hypothetical protein D9617_22g066490 [Elsinoe fawcettii]|nr:Hypothetical protein D9617_22g066490 [Elsinoe fawcettii]